MRNKLAWLSLAIALGFVIAMPMSGGQSLLGSGLAWADSEHEGHGSDMSREESRSGGEIADAEDEGLGESEGAGQLGSGPVFNENLPCTDAAGCEKKL